MKRTLKVWSALLLVSVFLCGAAFAEGTTGEKRFENTWVADNFHIVLYREAGGWIGEIEQLADLDKLTGFIWEVHADYDGSSDTLKAASVLKWDAFMRDGEMIEGDHCLYEDAASGTTFAIDADGKLIWNDAKEQAGEGLKFEAIGNFEGKWPGRTEGENAEILWADDHYTVYVDVINDRGEKEAYAYKAYYVPETDSLDASGTCDVITYENGRETGRVELADGINAKLYVNEKYDLVWENTAPQGVKTRSFKNRYGASAE